VSKRHPTTLAHGLEALFEQTAQRIRDGVRSPGTLEMQRAHGRWLCGELGGRRQLRTITEPLLEALAAPRVPARRFGPSTLRKRLTTLSGVLKVAHRRRWIPRIPAFPEVLVPWRPRQRYLRSYADAVRLFESLPPHRALWFWVCLWTGQHASDVERMRWSEVDLAGRKPSFLIRCSKNKKVALRVRMPRPLARVLRAEFRRRGPRAGDGPVVQPWPHRSQTLHMHCYRLGLPPLAPIDLRHTCATWMVRRLGITPAVCAWFGHSSPSMMARTYAHALTAGLDEVAEELDAFAAGGELVAA
jgi:integrase